MAGSVSAWVTTALPNGVLAGPLGTSGGSFQIDASITSGVTTLGADFFFPNTVHATGSVTGDIGPLPGQPSFYFYNYDLWDRQLPGNYVYPPTGGGAFDLVVGPGHLDIYPLAGFDGWLTPPSQTGVQVPLDGGTSGLSFVYRARAVVNYQFQDDSASPVTLHCYCLIYLRDEANYYHYLTHYDYPYYYADTFGYVDSGYTFDLVPPALSGYQTPATQSVTTVGGQTYTLTFTYAAPRGYVTGTVTDNGVTPVGVQGITVSYTNTGGTFTGSTTTAADGSYSLHVPPGTYTVTFTYYDSRYAMPSPLTGIVVTDGATTAGHDAVANRRAFITGVLIDTAATPTPVSGVQVAACRTCYASPDATDTTDAAGDFTLQVDANRTYAVQPYPTDGFTRLRNADGGVYDVAVAGRTTTSTLAANLIIARNGTVSGHIEDDTLAALVGATVQTSYWQYWSNPGCEFCYYGRLITETSVSDGTGHYSLSAPVGSDSLQPQFLTGYSTGSNAGPFTVTAATDTPNPTPIVYTRDAVASGVVGTDQATHPVVTVRMTGYDAGYRHYYSDSTTSDPLTGAYSLNLIANSPSQTLYIDDFVPGFGFADPRSVSEAGRTPTESVTQDFLFHSFGAIQGDVRKADGTAPPGPVHLYVYVTNPNGSQYFCSTYETAGDPAQCYTDSNGHYSISVMCGNATVYATTKFAGLGQAGDVGMHSGGGAPATVTPSMTTTGIDFRFDDAVALTATAAGDTGSLPGQVTIYDSQYDRWGRYQGQPSLITASGGGSVVFSAPPGTSYVGVYSGFAHWQSPAQQTVAIAVSTPASTTLTYQRLGTIQVILQDDSTPANTIAYGYYVYAYNTTSGAYTYIYMPYGNTAEVLPDTYRITPPDISP